MSFARRSIVIALLVLAAPAAAAEFPVSTVASFGPAPVVGIGAGRFGSGRTMDLQFAWHPEQRTNWILRCSHTDLSRSASLFGESTSGAFFSGGVLYVPPSPEGSIDVGADQVLVGVRRTQALGRVHPFVEAAAGASLVRDEHSRVEGLITNDRRMAWDAHANAAGLTTTAAPAFSLGVGFETLLPWRLALASAVSADFTAMRGLVGAVVPVRVGARWPSGALPELRPASDRAPRLRLSAGASALGSPAVLKGGLGDGYSVAAELELPIRENLALSLVGEQATRNHRETLYRKQTDNFGNIVGVVAGSSEASLAATAMTAGVRAQHRAGPASFSIRTGAGWGRTSGFGTSIVTPNGAYIDASGNWIPSWELMEVGLGESAAGWAYALSASAETAVAGPLRAFVEGGLTSIELRDRSVHTTPLRFGVALR